MNRFIHVELNTGDVTQAKKFYQGLFEWKLTDMPMGPMTYTMINTGKKGEGGGITAKSMPESPTMWLPYVEVDSVKRTIGKARTRGAKILVEYQEIPGSGAMGLFVDPTGAALGVWEQGKKPAKKAAKKAGKKK